MYQTINEYDFTDAFKRIRPENFSYQGLQVLFNGLEQYEIDTGESVEFDVIGICCDFSENSEDEIKQYYSNLIEKDDEDVEGFLEDNTWVLGSYDKDGKKYFVYCQF